MSTGAQSLVSSVAPRKRWAYSPGILEDVSPPSTASGLNSRGTTPTVGIAGSKSIGKSKSCPVFETDEAYHERAQTPGVQPWYHESGLFGASTTASSDLLEEALLSPQHMRPSTQGSRGSRPASQACSLRPGLRARAITRREVSGHRLPVLGICGRPGSSGHKPKACLDASGCGPGDLLHWTLPEPMR